MRCLKCGYENEKSARFCVNCGSRLGIESAKKILDDVIDKQLVDVDTVSGATLSSNGIISAMKTDSRDSRRISSNSSHSRDNREIQTEICK